MSYVACVIPLSVLGYGYVVSRAERPVPEKPRTFPSRARQHLRLAKDSRAGDIERIAQATTVAELLRIERPQGGTTRERHAPFETTLWRVECEIVDAYEREDGDFYLVIQSPDGKRTVAEVPDPKHLADSHYREEITATRELVRKRLTPTRQPKACSI